MMRNTIKLKYIWCTLFLLLHWGFVKAQPICVARQYTVRDGLIQSNPAQILQSHNGFIWVSTWNGVSRFDGRDFETFQFDSLLNQHMQLSLIHIYYQEFAGRRNAICRCEKYGDSE